MTRIKQTDIVPAHMIVAAKMYHQGRGRSRVRVPRMYMISDNRDGSNMQECLLTRYISPDDVAMSGILELQCTDLSAKHENANEKAYEMVEVCQTTRNREEQMIMAWCSGKGAATCENEYSI